MATDRIILQYEADVKKLKAQLNDVERKLGQTEKKAKKSAQGIGRSFGGLKTIFAGTLGALTVDRLVTSLISAGRESLQLALKAEGIERAFDRLNNPNLLKQLREQTRGTVSDLELMRQAVRASNFQVPLEKLATFFQFANIRARETGESVDFLVSSIIDGIGRKSTLVLDNLGISASELQKQIKITGDFGAAAGVIIEKELAKAGDQAITASEKVDRLNARMQNLSVGAGRVLLNIQEGFVDIASTALDVLFALGTGFRDMRTEAEDTDEAVQDLWDTLSAEEVKVFEEGIEDALKVQRLLNEELKKGEMPTQKYIDQVKEQVKVERDLIREQEEDNKQKALAIRNVFVLKKLIKEQSEIIEGEGSTIGMVNQAIAERNRLQTELDTLLGKETESQREANKAREEALELLKKTADEQFKAVQETEQLIEDLKVKTIADEFEREEARLELERQRRETEIEESLAFEVQKAEALELVEEEFLMAMDDLDKRRTDAEKAQSEERKRNAEEEERFKRATIRAGGEAVLSLVATIGGKRATQSKSFALFEIAVNQGIAISEALKDAQQLGIDPISKTFFYLQAIAQILSATAQARAVIDSAPTPQFAEGTSDAPGGLAIVGEKGKEAMIVPKHSAIISHDPTVKYKDEIKAMNSGTFEQLIADKYVLPSVNKQAQIKQLGDNISASIRNSFDDTGMRTDIRRNKAVKIENAKQMSKLMADAMMQRDYFNRRYA